MYVCSALEGSRQESNNINIIRFDGLRWAGHLPKMKNTFISQKYLYEPIYSNRKLTRSKLLCRMELLLVDDDTDAPRDARKYQLLNVRFTGKRLEEKLKRIYRLKSSILWNVLISFGGIGCQGRPPVIKNPLLSLSFSTSRHSRRGALHFHNPEFRKLWLPTTT